MKLPFRKKARPDEDDDDFDFSENFEEADGSGADRWDEKAGDDEEWEDDGLDLERLEGDDDDEEEAPRRTVLLLIGGVAAALILAVLGGAFLLMGGGEDDETASKPEDEPGVVATAELPPAVRGDGGLLTPPAEAEVAAKPASTGGTSGPPPTTGATPPPEAAPDAPLLPPAPGQGDPNISSSQQAIQNLRALLRDNTQAETDPDRGRIIPFATQSVYASIQPHDGGDSLGRVPNPELVDEQPDGSRLPQVSRGGLKPMEAYARPTPTLVAGVPQVAILIRGLGLSRVASLAAIRSLPPEVGFVIDPYAKDPEDWVLRARLAGHEVYLGFPWESREFPLEDAGPLALQSGDQLEVNVSRMHKILGTTVGYVGVVTQFGSKFGAAEGQLKALFTELRDRGLMFVEGGETDSKAVPRIAAEVGLPKAVANVLLDQDPAPAKISGQITRFEGLARTQAFALAIGEPNPSTLKLLSKWIASLDSTRLQLVPVSALADKQFIQ